MRIFTILIISTLSYGKILFQENFEGPLYHYTDLGANIVDTIKADNSKAAVIDHLKKAGMIDFQMPFKLPYYLAFDFMIVGPSDASKKANRKSPRSSMIFAKHIIDRIEADSIKELSENKCFLSFGGEGENPFLYIVRMRDTLAAFPVAKNRFHTFCIHVQKDSGATGSIHHFLMNGELIGKRFSRFIGDSTCRIIVQLGNTEEIKATQHLPDNIRLVIDNVILSDSMDTLSLLPPEMKFYSPGPGKMAMSLFTNAADSVILFLVADNPDFIFPILYRSIPVIKCSPFIPYYTFPQGTYYSKSAVTRKNGLTTNYTPVMKLGLPDDKTLETHPNIMDVEIYNKKNRETSLLVPEEWYTIKVRLNRMDFNGYILLRLHSRSNALGDIHDRGGEFDRKSNYIFNFSKGLINSFFVKEERYPRQAKSITPGTQFLYIDDIDSVFKIDTLKKTAQVRFKLFKETVPGNWEVSGYVETRDSLFSYPFKKRYRVISEMQLSKLQQKEFRNKIGKATVLILFFLGSLASILFMRHKKTGQREKMLGLLETARGKQTYLLDDGYKHRHIITKVQFYIYENYTGHISIADITHHLNLSQAWILKIFKEATGLTIIQFINRLRMEDAAEKLKGASLNITDIAMSVGFSSIDHFTRVFKSFAGMNPTCFRKKYQ